MNMMSVSFLAEAAPGVANLAIFGAMIACGLIILGVGLGIGLIAKNAVTAIARQPESGGRIFTAMIVAAALIEGVSFFALLVCLLTVIWFK